MKNLHISHKLDSFVTFYIIKVDWTFQFLRNERPICLGSWYYARPLSHFSHTSPFRYIFEELRLIKSYRVYSLLIDRFFFTCKVPYVWYLINGDKIFMAHHLGL